MANVAQVHEARARRQRRIRARVIGTGERPRLNVFRSLQHIYAQVIDDSIGHTLASASTLEKEIEAQCKDMTKSEAARIVGRIVAQRALASGVTQVVFDRGGHQYHGRIKALAEAAREAGLDF